MGTYPHHADPSREPSSAAPEPDAEEPRVPRPLPRNDRKWPNVAVLLLLLGLAVVALVVLL